LAQNILPKKKAGEYNQAIMDFGAVICKPYPECKICVFNQHCEAYLHGKQDLLPVKEKQIKIKERWLNYFVIKYKDEVLLRQRTSKDIWQQLFEFVLIETDKSYNNKKLLNYLNKQFAITPDNSSLLYVTKQKLSHQLINFSFLEIKLDRKEKVEGFSWVKIADLGKYTFPKTLQDFVTAQLE
jgi:A/G-specific adenine glycosylase